MKKITDEEIKVEAVEYANQHRYTASPTGWFEKEITDFEAGAKWYREQMDREQDDWVGKLNGIYWDEVINELKSMK